MKESDDMSPESLDRIISGAVTGVAQPAAAARPAGAAAAAARGGKINPLEGTIFECEVRPGPPGGALAERSITAGRGAGAQGGGGGVSGLAAPQHFQPHEVPLGSGYGGVGMAAIGGALDGGQPANLAAAAGPQPSFASSPSTGPNGPSKPPPPVPPVAHHGGKPDSTRTLAGGLRGNWIRCRALNYPPTHLALSRPRTAATHRGAASAVRGNNAGGAQWATWKAVRGLLLRMSGRWGPDLLRRVPQGHDSTHTPMHAN